MSGIRRMQPCLLRIHWQMPLTMTGTWNQDSYTGSVPWSMSIPQFRLHQQKLRTSGHPYRLVRRFATARCNSMRSAPAWLPHRWCSFQLHSRTGQSCRRHPYPWLPLCRFLQNPPKSQAPSLPGLPECLHYSTARKALPSRAAIHTVHPSYIRFPDIYTLLCPHR